jgi:hypothetical protein
MYKSWGEYEARKNRKTLGREGDRRSHNLQGSETHNEEREGDSSYTTEGGNKRSGEGMW